MAANRRKPRGLSKKKIAAILESFAVLLNPMTVDQLRRSDRDIKIGRVEVLFNAGNRGWAIAMTETLWLFIKSHNRSRKLEDAVSRAVAQLETDLRQVKLKEYQLTELAGPYRLTLKMDVSSRTAYLVAIDKKRSVSEVARKNVYKQLREL